MLSFLYDYAIGGDAIKIRLFGWFSVYSIKYTAIESLLELGWRDLPPDFTTLRLGNRLAGNCVLIVTSRGLFRRIALTPRDACEFVNDVNARLR